MGGGRWARVLTNVLARWNPVVPQIHLVSPRNAQGIRDWLAAGGVRSRFSSEVSVWSDLAAVLRRPGLGAVVVANHPARHAASAREALQSGIPVLVEKPFCARRSEAEELIALAQERQLALAVGHEFRYAGWAHHLRELLSAHTVTEVHLNWREAVGDLHHGDAKRPDWSVNVAMDLLPHVLSLLEVVLGPSKTTVEDADFAPGGQTIHLRLRCGMVLVSVQLSRSQDAAQRTCRILTASGCTVTVDFHAEPATIRLQGSLLTVPDAMPTLVAQFRDFFRCIQGRGGSAVLATSCLSFLDLTEEVSRRLQAPAQALMRAALAAPLGAPLATEVGLAMREHLVTELHAEGLLGDPKHEADLRRWTAAAFHIVRQLAAHPFASAAELCEGAGVNSVEYVGLCRALRRSPFLQQLMLDGGIGRKYWQNTILPIAHSGALRAALERTVQYPFRVGLYPGPTCMFKCTFCGRNYDARYAPADVRPGNEILMRILREAPQDDPHRFYISGGLEPLTNPGIGELVDCGAKRGFSLSMYTNAMALTPRLIELQPGIWSLHTLRISLYGVDESSTFAVTRRKLAFAHVLRNSEYFLRERNRTGAATRIGFNFVILPGCADQVLKVAELIAELNRSVGGRQVDFLTLREDYSADRNRAIVAHERRVLMDCFARLRARARQPDLDELEVDYGYSLQALADGSEGRSLEFVDAENLNPTAYPQISVVVDLLGDIYAYREAGFIARPGADRYVMGRVGPRHSFMDVIREFIESGRTFSALPEDVQYLDIFDHVVSQLIHQAVADARVGTPFADGPVTDRNPAASGAARAPRVLAHPTLEARA